MEKSITIRYEEFDDISELALSDQELIQCAMDANNGAYAPYSGFKVGAAVRLDDDTIVKGNNQENIAYPSGLCAERTAMFAASAQYPEKKIKALAIIGKNQSGIWTTASPCGACRQVMAEYEQRSGKKMRILTYLDEGKIRIFNGVESLLPFIFNTDLTKK